MTTRIQTQQVLTVDGPVDDVPRCIHCGKRLPPEELELEREEWMMADEGISREFSGGRAFGGRLEREWCFCEERAADEYFSSLARLSFLMSQN